MNTQKIRTAFKAFIQPSAKNAITVENAALVLWLFAVVASTLTHELWRDETREYLMAVGIDNFADYFNFAKYDGHPLLWRTILMAMHVLIPHPVALQMASLSIGFLTVYLIVKHSPFPLVIKVLFAFLLPFLVHEIKINSTIVREEARVEKSTALAVGKYLTTNKQLEKAIIIGSPEYAIEPIAFYAKNKNYRQKYMEIR